MRHVLVGLARRRRPAAPSRWSPGAHRWASRAPPRPPPLNPASGPSSPSAHCRPDTVPPAPGSSSDSYSSEAGPTRPARRVPRACRRRSLALRDGASYDPATDTWQPIADAPVPVSGGDPLVLDDQLYLLVGDSSRSDSPISFLRYDPGTDAWTALPTPDRREWSDLIATDRAIVSMYSPHEKGPKIDQVLSPGSAAPAGSGVKRPGGRRSRRGRRAPGEPGHRSLDAAVTAARRSAHGGGRAGQPGRDSGVGRIDRRDQSGIRISAPALSPGQRITSRSRRAGQVV